MLLAPILAVFPVLMSLAVITFCGPGFVGADLNIGVLYLVALGFDRNHGGADGRLEQQQQVRSACRFSCGGPVALL